MHPLSINPFSIDIIQRGRESFTTTFDAMLKYTQHRHSDSADQLWIVEHDPAFTLGLAADKSHVLNAHQIEVIQTDRGGEVTYHGPGQVVIYLLLDLKRRRQIGLVRELVQKIEQAVINTLFQYQITGVRKAGAPGIYIANGDWQGAKIAALGLKIRANGMTYHGVSLNVAMDLTPFSYINPCGYSNLTCVDMQTLGFNAPLSEIQNSLAQQLIKLLS